MAIHMITTTDNPFNPFTHYDEWLAYDEEHGYYTNNYLARLVSTSDELSDEENNSSIELAIDEIVEMNLLGIYKKVTKEETN